MIINIVLDMRDLKGCNSGTLKKVELVQNLPLVDALFTEVY